MDHSPDMVCKIYSEDRRLHLDIHPIRPYFVEKMMVKEDRQK